MSYEFSKDDELIISSISMKGIYIAAIISIISVIDIFYILTSSEIKPEYWVYLTQGVLQIGIGIAFLLPFNNFRNVVTTSGNDVEAILAGMEKMTLGFKLISLFVLLVFLLGFVVIILLL
jgi:uncharacterized membrane protein